MKVTLCMLPRSDEKFAVIHFLLRRNSTTMELPSRHRVDGVIWDSQERTVALVVEIADPATARPIDVRIDVLPMHETPPRGRTMFLGDVDGDGGRMCVYGTYLGVVAHEN